MKTLYGRLTLSHTLVALLAVLLVALMASRLIAQSYIFFAQQRAQLAQQNSVRLLEQYYARTRSWHDMPRIIEERFETDPRLNNQRMVLANEHGIVIFDSADLLDGQRLPPHLHHQSTPIHYQRRVVGLLVLPIGEAGRSELERAFIRNITRIVIVGSVLSGGLALLVALLISRHLTRPLRSMTVAARRLAAGERHQPLTVPSAAELADLAHAFNSMAADLAHQEQIRRQLMADIAHELRTPLSVLRLQIEGLEDGVEQATPEMVASLHEEVNLLTRLVDDLRLLSLADAGQLSLSTEPLRPQSVLEHAAAVAAPHARQQGITLRVEPSGGLPAVCADRQRLNQVLGNLVDNALRYTPQGGTVVLRAYRAAGEPGQREQVIFEVADTGQGIAADALPHIFDRFYRTDRARTREKGGSGLGLAIVQRLVEAQHGAVRVESTPGQGTTFFVALPLAAAGD